MMTSESKVKINALGTYNMLAKTMENNFNYSNIIEQGYVPPEILLLMGKKEGEPALTDFTKVKFPKNEKVDVFILGVILFNIVTGGEMPFDEALVENGKYKYFVKGHQDLYWKL